MNVSEIHSQGLDVENREIYIAGDTRVKDDEPGIDFVTSTTFIKNVNILKKQGSGPITIHMNSQGGCWNYGMAMYDAIKHCGCETTAIVHSWARSMTSIILQAATKRIMMPHATFMIHLGTGFYEGHYLTAQSAAKQDALTVDLMLECYSKRAINGAAWEGYDNDEIKARILARVKEKGDWWLNAEETVLFGFADEVVK
jgi:ATP-dependent protease ClpP protease subunit